MIVLGSKHFRSKHHQWINNGSESIIAIHDHDKASVADNLHIYTIAFTMNSHEGVLITRNLPSLLISNVGTPPICI